MRKTPYILVASVVAGLLSGCSFGPTTSYPLLPAETTTKLSESFDNGFIYENGLGTPRNYEKAAYFYSKAAAKGDARAINNLGVMAAQGRGSSVSGQKALSYFRDAAARSSAAAHYNIGLMYDAGTGLGRSRANAAAEYRMAAEMGHAAAQQRLAEILRSGDGVAADPQEAARLSEMAASRGDADALAGFPSLAGADLRTISKYFAVEHCGSCGSAADKGMAGRQIAGLSDLAAKGDAVAQYNLGVHYLQGNGAVLDPSEAARLFTLSGRQGYAAAQRQLAQMHLRGQAVAQSKVLAHAWLNLASKDAGEEGAKAAAEMESLEVSMSADEIREAQSIAASGALKGR
ncbi:tetratricopeptide repeat protein [Rhizobium leguminosarum]|uniref:tetratricopeptide repeat protein n=1 Tax=Rhizobium leguminosarum TaxID=384 RepID=UPI002E14F267|nr:tetratricopeptide repeat protein [Rhizobium leguminosarum]